MYTLIGIGFLVIFTVCVLILLALMGYSLKASIKLITEGVGWAIFFIAFLLCMVYGLPIIIERFDYLFLALF